MMVGCRQLAHSCVSCCWSCAAVRADLFEFYMVSFAFLATRGIQVSDVVFFFVLVRQPVPFILTVVQQRQRQTTTGTGKGQSTARRQGPNEHLPAPLLSRTREGCWSLSSPRLTPPRFAFLFKARPAGAVGGQRDKARSCTHARPLPLWLVAGGWWLVAGGWWGWGVVQGLARSSGSSTSASLGSICRCAFPAVRLSFRPLLPGFALTPPFLPAAPHHQASGTSAPPPRRCDEM
jgi:hypothetical protein